MKQKLVENFLVVFVTRRVQRVGIILESKYSSIPNREHVAVLIQSNTDERSGQPPFCLFKAHRNAINLKQIENNKSNASKLRASYHDPAHAGGGAVIKRPLAVPNRPSNSQILCRHSTITWFFS
jgi:hypothetical protein